MVEMRARGEVGLALVALDDGLAGAGGGLPVDVGHVVAGAVGGQIVEVLAHMSSQFPSTPWSMERLDALKTNICALRAVYFFRRKCF